jgi:hypothetical protein
LNLTSICVLHVQRLYICHHTNMKCQKGNCDFRLRNRRVNCSSTKFGTKIERVYFSDKFLINAFLEN